MNKKKFDLVIFDCDGVLFDSKEANRQYYNELLKRLSLPAMSELQLEYCHSHTADESIAFLLNGLPQLVLQRAKQEVKNISYDDFLKYMSEEPGMRETVSFIKKNIPTAIATNRTTTMPLLVKMYSLDTLFDKIVCALDVKKAKPDPECIYNILQYFNIPANRAVYIGDTVVDQYVAEAAGIPLIAYKNNHLDAMFHVEHFDEIKEIVLGGCN